MRDTLARLGLTQADASRLLHVTDRTVRRWCEPDDAPGHRSVPAAVWLLLGVYEHVPGAREWLEQFQYRLRPPPRAQADEQ
jgi:hypothetical protein